MKTQPSKKVSQFVAGYQGPKPILYFSGFRGSTKTFRYVIEKGGMNAFCASFGYLWEDSPLFDVRMPGFVKLFETDGRRYFLDSGAFQFHSRQQSGKVKTRAQDFIASYRNFLIDGGCAKADFHITFDYVKHAPTVYKVTAELAAAGVRTVPVFHGDSSIDWFKRYIDDGHRLICVGRIQSLGSVWLYRYYDELFNLATKANVMLHGLMVTGANLFRFPWFSVDSASWVRTAAVGTLLDVDHQRRKVRSFHVSQLTTPPRFGKHTVSLEQMRDHWYYRAAYNVRALGEAASSIPQAAVNINLPFV